MWFVIEKVMSFHSLVYRDSSMSYNRKRPSVLLWPMTFDLSNYIGEGRENNRSWNSLRSIRTLTFH